MLETGLEWPGTEVYRKEGWVMTQVIERSKTSKDRTGQLAQRKGIGTVSRTCKVYDERSVAVNEVLN